MKMSTQCVLAVEKQIPHEAWKGIENKMVGIIIMRLYKLFTLSLKGYGEARNGTEKGNQNNQGDHLPHKTLKILL